VSELITTEIGKTLRSADEEVTKCVAALRFYSERGPEFLRVSRGAAAEVGADQTYVSYQPLGVVLAIM
jgi:succinate-semialdehyde dehydrogenase/glutarate-semialdehyde dehydrogenase